MTLLERLLDLSDTLSGNKSALVSQLANKGVAALSSLSMEKLIDKLGDIEVVNGLQDAGQLEIIENGIYTPPAGSGYTSIVADVQNAVNSSVVFDWSHIAGNVSTDNSSTIPAREKTEGIFRAAIFRISGKVWEFRLYGNIPAGQTYLIKDGTLLFVKAYSLTSGNRNITTQNVTYEGDVILYLEDGQWKILINGSNTGHDVTVLVTVPELTTLVGNGAEQLYLTIPFSGSATRNFFYHIFFAKLEKE